MNLNDSLDSQCFTCEKTLIDNDRIDLGQKCCDICFRDICNECYDKEKPIIKSYGLLCCVSNGWICHKCKSVLKNIIRNIVSNYEHTE